MSPLGMQAGVRQILPVLAVWTGILCNVTFAQSGQPVNEGGSTESEPHVILSDNKGGIPVRAASTSVQDSTDPLVKLVWETRESTRQRLLSTKDHTPWQIMHGLLGLRQDFLISHKGKPVSGLEWIQSGPTYQNEPWFETTQYGGRAHPFSKPYWFEGHVNQFLAILATCNLPLETTFQTATGPITMKDMLRNAQMTVNAREEVTWTLWALATYLPSDATWVNAAGEQWSIEKLVQIETGKKVGGPTSPCGGTHGLFALARARNVYLRTGKPLRGVWFEADQKIKKYIEVARVLCNTDGSLTSGFFKTREFKQDFDKRMASEGHLLEFLMMSVSQQQLKEPWIRTAIETTARDLMSNRREYVSCSPLYHATNALSIYLDRVAPDAPENVAEKPSATKSAALSKESPLVRQQAPVAPGKSTPKDTATGQGTPTATAPAVPQQSVPHSVGTQPGAQPMPAGTPAQPSTEPSPQGGPVPSASAPPKTPEQTAQPAGPPKTISLPPTVTPMPPAPLSPPAEGTDSSAKKTSTQPATAVPPTSDPPAVEPGGTASAAVPDVRAASPLQVPLDGDRQAPTASAAKPGPTAPALPSPLKAAPVTTPAPMRAGSASIPGPMPIPGAHRPLTSQSRAAATPSTPPPSPATVGKIQVTPRQPDPTASESSEIISLGDFLSGKTPESTVAPRKNDPTAPKPGEPASADSPTNSRPSKPKPAAMAPAPQSTEVKPASATPSTAPQQPSGTIKRPLKSGTPTGRGKDAIWQSREDQVMPASATEPIVPPLSGSSKVIGTILQMSGSEPASRPRGGQ